MTYLLVIQLGDICHLGSLPPPLKSNEPSVMTQATYGENGTCHCSQQQFSFKS